MQKQDLEIMGVTYEVVYEQEYNSVFIYDVKEIDNPFKDTEEDITYKEGELWGYLTEMLVEQYEDSRTW